MICIFFSLFSTLHLHPHLQIEICAMNVNNVDWSNNQLMWFNFPADHQFGSHLHPCWLQYPSSRYYIQQLHWRTPSGKIFILICSHFLPHLLPFSFPFSLPRLDFDDDLLKSLNLRRSMQVRYCSENGKRLIHFSTCEVYGKTIGSFLPKDHPLRQVPLLSYIYIERRHWMESFEN